MRNSPIFLSLVIPAYNESRVIAASLLQVGEYLAAEPYTSEIVIVDDGSNDGTASAAYEAAKLLTVPVRYLRYEPNRGKGYALKVGFHEAAGSRILFSDADLSTPIEETSRLLAELERGAEIAIGTRKSDDAEIAIHQPRFREFCGQVFTFLVRHLLVDVTDVTCGFKAFAAGVGKDLFGRQRVSDWSFDAELLFVARQQGRRLVEVPVYWEDRAGTKVSIFRDAIGSLLGLVRIRLHSALGHYSSHEALGVYHELWRTDPQTAVSPDAVPVQARSLPAD